MNQSDTVIVIVLSLIGLYFYSNQELLKNNNGKKYGSFNIASQGEEDEKFPSGHALGSMTFQEHSPSVLRVWYAST
jgi:hypothetical protein